MPSSSHFTTSSILAFIALGLIRGSFSVVIHFADLSYNSPSLVFLLRTPGTVFLYVCLLIFVARRDTELKHTFLNNLRNIHNYWKSAVMGFLQLAAPYLLFMYGLKVMSPTAGGVFMAAAPWTTVMLERLPFIRVSFCIILILLYKVYRKFRLFLSLNTSFCKVLHIWSVIIALTWL